MEIISVAEFCRTKNICYATFLNWLHKLDLKIIPQEITSRKSQINENYFENIDCEEKAYILGFLFADGNVSEKSHKVSVQISYKDKDILIKMCNILFNGDTSYIKEYKYDRVIYNKDNNKTYSFLDHKAAIFLINKKIADDLIKLGCMPNKTLILKFPILRDDLIQHFIRGYFDGDGSLTINVRKLGKICKNGKICKYRATDAYFSIVGTKDIIDNMAKYISLLGAHYEINKRHPERNNNNYTIRVSGNKQIKKICDYLYDNSTIYLDRKYDTYIRLSNMRNKIEQKQEVAKNLKLNKLPKIRHSNICEFIEKANKIYGALYNYNKADYINSRTKLEITCNTHGSFFKTPNNHLRGQGCPSCYKEKRNIKRNKI
jgi:hypothetical protein